MNNISRTIIRYILAVSILAISILTISIVHTKHTKKTITFSIYSGNNWGVPQNFTYAIYDKAVEMYESVNPNVKIEIQLKTGTMYDDYSEVFAQSILKGEEPDIFLILEGNFNTYASIGILENLDPYLSKDSDFPLDALYQRSLEAGQYHGKQYSLPISIVPSFIVMNKNLLSEAGIEIDREEWTWDKFYDACAKLTTDSDGDGILDQFGVQGYDWHHAFYTNDQSLFSENGKSISFDEDRMLQTIIFLKKLQRLNPGQIISERDFENGNVGFKTSNMSEYRAYGTYPYRILKYKNFEWEAIPFPGAENGSNTSKLFTVQIGMSSRSRSKKAAISFIKFLTSDEEFQYEVWKDTNTLPSNSNVVERVYDEGAYDDSQIKLFDHDLLVEIINNSYTNPDFKIHSYLDEVISQNMYQFVSQDRDPRIDVMELKKNIQSVYRKYFR